MIVPTKDYTPLRQANAARTQGKRAQFVAPSLDYERQSLEIRKEGLKQKVGEIKSQEGWNAFHFAVGMGQLAVKTASVVENYQLQKADSQVKTKVSDYETEMARRWSTGELSVDENGNIQGLDSLNEYQQQQLKDIENNKWFKSVKNAAKEALQGVYAERENTILKGIYENTINKTFQQEQESLASYINNDASRLDFSNDNAYTLTDSYIDSMKNITTADKTLLKTQAHKEIDLKRAQNSVSAVARAGGYDAAIKVADAWVADKNYDQDTRENLYSIAGKMSRLATNQAMDAGLEYMAKGLTAGQSPAELRKAADDMMAGKPEEQKEAFISGINKAQLQYCNNIIAEITKDIPETLTSADVADMIDRLKEQGDSFKGNPDTEKLLDDTIAKWQQADQILVSKDYSEKYDSLKSIYLPRLMDGSMSPKQVLDMIGSGMEMAKENGDNNKLAAYQQFKQDVEKQVLGDFVNPAIKEADQTIADTMKWWYGDKTFKGNPYVRGQYNDIVAEADAAIIDLCMNKGKLSNAEIEKVANEVMGRYAGQEAVMRAAAEGDGYVARQTRAAGAAQKTAQKTAQKGTGKAAPEPEYSNPSIADLSSSLLTAIKSENSKRETSEKKDDYKDAEKYERNAAALTKIQKDSLPLLDDMMTKMPPSGQQDFADQMNDQYFIFKKDPAGWLEKFNETRTSDKVSWIDNPGEDYTVKTSFQNMKLFDPELEAMYPLVSGTPEGRAYAARRNALEEGMIANVAAQQGQPIDPLAWEPPIYRPDADGFVYMNGDNIYRVVKEGDGFIVQILGAGDNWNTVEPQTKLYDGKTPEEVDRIKDKNKKIIEKMTGKGNATKYYNPKTGEYQDTDPNKAPDKSWWWR